jgi:hypothetical protein
MQETLGNVVSELMFHLNKNCEKFSSRTKEMYYVTVSLYVEVLIMVCHIDKSENFPLTAPNIRSNYETKLAN